MGASDGLVKTLGYIDAFFPIVKVIIACVTKLATWMVSVKLPVAYPALSAIQIKLMTAVDMGWSAIKGLSLHLPTGIANAVAAWATLDAGYLIIADMASGSGASSASGGSGGGSSGQFARRSGGSGNFLVPAGIEPSW